MGTKHFQLLLEHEHWANQRLICQMQALREIPANAKRLFDHIIGAQHIWIARMKGEIPMLAVWPTLMPEHWDSMAKDNFEELMKISSSETSLNKMVTYTNTEGQAFTNPIYELLIHLCLHSQYHRGQVVTHIRHLVEKPLSTDMIAYLRSLL